MSKRQEPHRDEKWQLKAIHLSSMNGEENFTPQIRLHLAQIFEYCIENNMKISEMFTN